MSRLPVLAAELVSLHVAIIAGNGVSALAVRAVTTTIPLVFQSAIRPVKSGLVASLGHPGANTTGVSFFGATMEIHEAAPWAAGIGSAIPDHFRAISRGPASSPPAM